jgi:uncharacterized membrane protein
MKMQIHETHARTVVKAIIYRVLSVISIIVLSLLFGASQQTAGIMGLVVVVVGTTIYYIHDRVWLKFSWLVSNDSGKDLISRSLLKTIIYRTITTLVGIVIARILLTDSTSTAIGFAVSQALVNALLFFMVERIANLISRGKRVSYEDNN